MHRSQVLALLAATLPSVAGALPFEAQSLRQEFWAEPPWTAGELRLAGEVGYAGDVARFLSDALSLRFDPAGKPFPAALSDGAAVYRSPLWGVGVAYRGQAVGADVTDGFRGEFVGLAAVNLFHEQRLMGWLRGSVEADLYTGADARYAFGSADVVQKRWYTGAQLSAGVRLDLTERLWVSAWPGLRYTALDLGDTEARRWNLAGRLEVAWHGRVGIPQLPLWITVAAWARDDYFGEHLGLRARLRAGSRFELRAEASDRWSEAALVGRPWPMLELSGFVLRDHEWESTLLGIGMRLYWSGFGVPAFFSTAR
jgi:hypothetical protein